MVTISANAKKKKKKKKKGKWEFRFTLEKGLEDKKLQSQRKPLQTIFSVDLK